VQALVLAKLMLLVVYMHTAKPATTPTALGMTQQDWQQLGKWHDRQALIAENDQQWAQNVLGCHRR
jgi:hypothetical protein